MAWLWWLLAPSATTVLGAWLFWLRDQRESGSRRGRSGIEEHQALLRALPAGGNLGEIPATMILLALPTESDAS